MLVCLITVVLGMLCWVMIMVGVLVMVCGEDLLFVE